MEGGEAVPMTEVLAAGAAAAEVVLPSGPLKKGDKDSLTLISRDSEEITLTFQAAKRFVTVKNLADGKLVYLSTKRLNV